MLKAKLFGNTAEMTRFERLPKVHTIEREDKMNNYKSGFVTLIGRPNVGKSTLMNRLIGQKIAITSNKPQTTRNRIQTVYTCDEGQIIFLDTPGIHKAKNIWANTWCPLPNAL